MGTRRFLAHATIVLGFACVSACGSVGPSVAPGSGLWTGTTAVGDIISFTVQATVLSKLSVTIKITGSCGISAVQRTYTTTFTIDSGAFTTGASADGTVSGTFTSSTDANGSANATVTTGSGGQPCSSTGSTTWTAHKV